MKVILDTVVSLFRTPAMFISLVALLGLVLQRKNFSDVIKGSLKTFIGMVILTKGVDIICLSITPLSTAFTQLFAIKGAPEIGNFSDFLGTWGSDVGLIMLGGFVLDVAIARFTKYKTIFLTANLLYWYPMIFIAVGVENQLTRTVMYAIAIICQIFVIKVMPTVMRKYVKELTGQDKFTIGHTTSIFCLLGIWIGSLFGKSEKNREASAEDLKLPSKLAFCKDTTIMSGIVITLVYIIASICIGPEMRATIYEGQPFVSVSITNGMTFAAGMLVLLQGVRMMLAEIVPAFKGIAMKLAPGAVPAMDIPLIFPYGPNSLLLGFIFAACANVVAIFALGSTGMLAVPIIPLMVACYFDVAPGAIFANKRGGIKAAITTGILGGVILTVLCAVSIPLVSRTIGTFVQAYGGNEFSVWILISDGIASLLHMIGL